MISQWIIHEFAPLCLSVDRIGPFQERLEEFDFTDAENEPCNFYLMVSRNGRGKTTVLELMTALMGMLGHNDDKNFAAREHTKSITEPFGFEPLDRGLGRAQWDIRIRYSQGGSEQTAVLSLLAGRLEKETSLRFWSDEELRTVGARRWHRFGFCRNDAGSWDTIGTSDEWVTNFNSWLAGAIGEKIGSFEDSSLIWPTLIYFSAYRNITPVLEDDRAIIAPADWNYRPMHAFRAEGGRWRDSLDNLLVWLKWLDDGRFERACELVNERVFDGTSTFLKGIRREPPEAIVIRDNNEHRLDALSSGEKSLVQLFLRLGAHMTRNTILLIDEPEAHLHDTWKYRLHTQLKQLAKDYFPGLTIIMATHSTEIMGAFGIEFPEENLRKGGYIIETVEEEQEVQRIMEDAKQRYGGAEIE